MPAILIIEDDPSLADLLRWHFEAEGYAVRLTGDGDEALLMVREQLPDAIILDWMIENLPGIEVCRQIRKDKLAARVPIIMLTARSDEDDRIRGIKTGADDYLTKPFSPRELLARVEGLLRRTMSASFGDILRVGTLELDRASHMVCRDGAPLHLGPTEFKLLCHFMERPGRVLSRSHLMDAVWGMDSMIVERTVDVHIKRLRDAINPPGQPNLIRTIRSVGYALDSG